MTVREIHNALDGYNEERKEKFNEYMIGVRRVCFWTVRAMGSKLRHEEQLFEMEIDVIARRERLKNWAPSEIIPLKK